MQSTPPPGRPARSLDGVYTFTVTHPDGTTTTHEREGWSGGAITARVDLYRALPPGAKITAETWTPGLHIRKAPRATSPTIPVHVCTIRTPDGQTRRKATPGGICQGHVARARILARAPAGSQVIDSTWRPDYSLIDTPADAQPNYHGPAHWTVGG